MKFSRPDGSPHPKRDLIRRWEGRTWEIGVDFFLETTRGVGFREPGPDGLIWCSPIGGKVALSSAQMLIVLAAAGEPLPGWPPGLPDDWLDEPRRGVRAGRKRPVAVLRAFREVLKAINLHYGSLIGTANKATATELRKRARKLEEAAIAFEASGAKRAFSGDNLLAQELAECRIAAANLLKYANRLRFTADVAETEAKLKQPLLHLMPSLVTCFEEIFDKDATRTWQFTTNPDGEEVAKVGGPFPPFAEALLREVGCRYASSTIHSTLGRWQRRQNPKES